MYMHQLLHSSENNMTNIFRISHILQTYLTSLQASEITAKYKKRGYQPQHKVNHSYSSITIILVIIFWNFTIFWYRPNSPPIHHFIMPSIANLVYELPNGLRPRILGNQEILEKSQIWVEAKPSAQSLFKKLDIGNSNQKSRKNGLLEFCLLFQIFCSGQQLIANIGNIYLLLYVFIIH